MKLQLRQEKSSVWCYLVFFAGLLRLACVCFIQCKEKRRMKRKSEEKGCGIFCSMIGQIGLVAYLRARCHVITGCSAPCPFS
ncbi:hypothetical protein T07_10046 [Trichinella nelsoni]|uniref:Uncharacterized protein n=1 Tax=Trichinella nelsoni TaxID=6336 RepID=A0A0V0RL26_9BILA|nr:hypothetical protein T07_10046 [Trichinella nelsoni]